MWSGILEWVCEVPLAEISLESVEGQQNRRGRVEGGRVRVEGRRWKRFKC